MNKLRELKNTRIIADALETKFNEVGELIYYKTSTGVEYWLNNEQIITHVKFPEGGRESWYNDNGHLVHEINPDGTEYKYDEAHRIIYRLDEDGEFLWKYDEKGNTMLYKHKCFDGSELCQEFDKDGNLIYFKDLEGKEEFHLQNEKGDIIFEQYRDGDSFSYRYDENGNIYYYKESNKYSTIESLYENDENGNTVHSISYDGFKTTETWYIYDEKGGYICKSSDGFIYYYDENDDLIKTILPSGKIRENRKYKTLKEMQQGRN